MEYDHEFELTHVAMRIFGCIHASCNIKSVRRVGPRACKRLAKGRHMRNVHQTLQTALPQNAGIYAVEFRLCDNVEIPDIWAYLSKCSW